MIAKCMRGRVAVATAALGLLTACGPGHRLAEFDFAGASLAVDYDLPPYPDVLTGPLSVRTDNPVQMVLDAGVRAARELQVGSLETKIDSATARVDVGALLQERIGEQASRYLGTRLATSSRDASYFLDVLVLEYGIVAADWDATAYFFIEAEATLLDRGTGAEIWRVGVGAREPLGPEIFTDRDNVRGAVTAAVLADLSVDDLARTLEQLAIFTARQVTDRLRDDLREARRRD